MRLVVVGICRYFCRAFRIAGPNELVYVLMYIILHLSLHLSLDLSMGYVLMTRLCH